MKDVPEKNKYMASLLRRKQMAFKTSLNNTQ